MEVEKSSQNLREMLSWVERELSRASSSLGQGLDAPHSQPLSSVMASIS